jgi:SAM-dependent methyltransferase
MANEPTPDNLDTLRAEGRAVWEGNAAFWDDYMGEAGNDFHRELVAPAAERLLALSPGERVLEFACGAGLFARRMAELGATVLATDVSDTFLERAKVRMAQFADRVTFRRVDATVPEELDALAAETSGGFDAAVCNMALMDIPVIEPLYAALLRLLKPGGRFVFTLMHPAFNTDGVTWLLERGETGTVHALKLTRYRTFAPSKGLGIIGQPREQYYYQRSLTDLLAPAFAHGLMLDGIEEPAFDPTGYESNPLSRRHYHEFPMVLAGRLRTPAR